MIILLIDENGTKIGPIEKEDALKMAIDSGKDLIMINATKHVYKIADAGKLKYEQKQLEKSQRAQKRIHKIKEIQFKSMTEPNDIEIKINKIKEFLTEGFKTKLVMKFFGREMTHKDIGYQKMQSIIARIRESGLGTLDKDIVFEGRNLIAFIKPKKDTK